MGAPLQGPSAHPQPLTGRGTSHARPPVATRLCRPPQAGRRGALEVAFTSGVTH